MFYDRFGMCLATGTPIPMLPMLSDAHMGVDATAFKEVEQHPGVSTGRRERRSKGVAEQ